MSERKTSGEMLGEVLRDIGVLIFVFFPFDEWITFHALTWRFVLGSVIMAMGSIAVGIWLERRRPGGH
ncbi:MAG TPA: hypothetical protein VFO27_11415 [Bryobacteraceae bacterium]|nr:hypothetical protein [Bryobacteraceae bacterium]